MAQTWLGMCFVPFPSQSSLSDQVLGDCTVPGGPCILITSLVLAAQYPGYTMGALSQVCCVSPLGRWSQAATLLAVVNCPGSQEDWLATWSLFKVWWRMPVSDWDCSNPLPSGCGCHPHASLPLGGGGACMQQASSPLVFAQLCSVSGPGCALEPFTRKLFCFVFPLLRSHSLIGYLTLAPSDCPPAFRFAPYPNHLLCSLHLLVQSPLAGGGHECLGYFSAGSCS